MQNNYYFLKKLTASLIPKLTGMEVVECYTQNKDELIIALVQPDDEKEFYIRALLRPNFSCLSFPHKLHRAKKNSVDLFDQLPGKRVIKIHQFLNERAFVLFFEENVQLLFKMHGNRSNVIFLENEKPKLLFNNRLPKDMEITLSLMDRPIDQSYGAFKNAEGDYKKLFPTFGKGVKKYLKHNAYDQLGLEQKWNLIEHVIALMEEDTFYILEDDRPQFSLIPLEFAYDQFSDPIVAVSTFYVRWLAHDQFYSRYNDVFKQLTNAIEKDIAYLDKSNKKLEEREKFNYRQLADILMANLHNVQKGEKKVTLENFYQNNEPIEISLNKLLSPQKNAERYYTKAKNQHKELEILMNNILKREKSLEEKRKILKEIRDIRTLKELNAIVPVAISNKLSRENLPYHHFEIDGFDILVGKSAKHNDILIQQHTHKNDLWLHARDVSGSHVIIKSGGTNVPLTTIEKVARIAAFNSKGKNDSLCPVIYTPRKYIRKRKGDPPGAVVVDREEVIMVEPGLP